MPLLDDQACHSSPKPRMSTLIWGPKSNTFFVLSNFSGFCRNIPAKPRDIPPKKFGFPGLEGHTELFGPHPIHEEDPHPAEDIRTQKFGFVLFFHVNSDQGNFLINDILAPSMHSRASVCERNRERWALTCSRDGPMATDTSLGCPQPQIFNVHNIGDRQLRTIPTKDLRHQLVFLGGVVCESSEPKKKAMLVVDFVGVVRGFRSLTTVA